MKRSYQSACSVFIFCTLFSCHKNGIPYTQDGDWVAEAQLNGAARSEAVSFVIDSMAYIGTGWDGLVTRYNDFWKYDLVMNVWVQVSSMPPGTQRSSAVAFSTADEKAYVGTGYDGAHYLNDFYRFDPATNGWTSVASYPGSPRYEAVAFSIGYFGYVGTGFDGANAQKDFYQYDPASDSWTDVGFSGNKRYAAVTFVYNNKGYVVTGVNSGVMQTDFWVFDPSASGRKWTELRHITNYSTDSYDDGYTTIVRMNGSAFVEGTRAYISTGENGVYNSNTWEYDFAGDAWKEKAPFEGPGTTGAVGFSLPGSMGGGGYIATGRSSPGQAGASDYLWQFFPGKTLNPNDN